ncbi:MAG: hypothetical protein IT331_21690 [Anaerolineae bacterium]|nr:hypothetical protein [Anaerolineae bacterium]
MKKTNPRAKSGKLRGTKVMLAALSVTATLTGWAWLTTQDMAFGADPDVGNVQEPHQRQRSQETNNSRGALWAARRQPLSTPNLAQLQVRGLPQIQAPSDDGTTVLPTRQDTPIQQSISQTITRRKTRSSR